MADEVTTPKAESAPTLADQYDIGDSSFDPELDATPTRQKSDESTPAKAKVERDPTTGKFKKVEPVAETPPEPVKQAKPKVSPRLARLAKEFGVGDDEIESSDPEQLKAIVEHETRRLIQEREYNRTFEGEGQRRTANLDGTIKEPSKPTNEDGIDFGVDESAYDPKFFNQLRSIIKDRDTRIAKLEEKLEAVEKHARRQADEAIYEQCDRAFAKHENILGKGGRYDIDPHSAEYERRMAVLASVQRDKGPGTLTHKIDRAVKRLYGAVTSSPSDPIEEESSPPPNGRFTKEQWNGAGLQRPTHRSGLPEPKGEKRAARAVMERMREKGITEDDLEGIEEAGIPD